MEEFPIVPREKYPSHDQEIGPSQWYDGFFSLIKSLTTESQEINPRDEAYSHILRSLSENKNPLKSLRQKFPGEWTFNPKHSQISGATKIYIEQRRNFIDRCDDISHGVDEAIRLPTNKPWTISFTSEISRIDTKAFKDSKKI